MVRLLYGANDLSKNMREVELERGLDDLSNVWILGDFMGDIDKNFENQGLYIHNYLSFWRQFGLIPQNNEGIYIGIDDIPTAWLQHNWYARSGSNVYTRGAKTGVDGINPLTLPRAMNSLVNLVGFDKKQKKLGKLRNSKK